jgi:drug/metabolite transporter (DMT)-like permease
VTARSIAARLGAGVATLGLTRADRALWDRVRLVLAFGAVYLIWGSTYLAIAVAVETIPPFTMIAGRCLLAGGVLYAVTRAGAGRPALRSWGRALVAGGLLFVTGQAMLAWAETRVASGPAAVLVATEPLFVALLGGRGGRLGDGGAGVRGGAGKGSAPSVGAVLALLAGFVGVAVMMLPGRMGGVDATGAVVIVLAALSWSIGLFHATPRENGSSVQTAGMQLIAGGAVLLVVAAATGELSRFEAAAVTRASLLAFVYLVLFGSLVTYVAYVWLLKRVGPARLSSHAYVNPLVAVVLGVLLVGERITPAVAVASVLILAAVVALVRPPRPGGRLPPDHGSDS